MSLFEFAREGRELRIAHRKGRDIGERRAAVIKMVENAAATRPVPPQARAA